MLLFTLFKQRMQPLTWTRPLQDWYIEYVFVPRMESKLWSSSSQKTAAEGPRYLLNTSFTFVTNQPTTIRARPLAVLTSATFARNQDAWGLPHFGSFEVHIMKLNKWNALPQRLQHPQRYLNNYLNLTELQFTLVHTSYQPPIQHLHMYTRYSKPDGAGPSRCSTYTLEMEIQALGNLPCMAEEIERALGEPA